MQISGHTVQTDLIFKKEGGWKEEKEGEMTEVQAVLILKSIDKIIERQLVPLTTKLFHTATNVGNLSRSV